MPADIPATVDSSARILPGSGFVGQIESAGDIDWIGIDGRPGAVWRLDLTGTGSAPLSDPALQGLFTPSGSYRPGTWDNDGGPGRASLLTVETEGAQTYYVAVAGHADATGDYRLTLTPLDRLEGTVGDDWLLWTPGVGLVRGNGGRFDALSFVGSDTGVSVNLDRGTALGLARFADDETAPVLISGIERITGSSYGDTLRGDADANVLRGLGGDDLIFASGGRDHYDGGPGIDTLSFADWTDPRGVNLYLGRGFGYPTGTGLSPLSWSGIERLIGSPGDDHLGGGRGNDWIDGGGGNDTIDGLIVGSDTVVAGGDDGDVTIRFGIPQLYAAQGIGVAPADNHLILRGSPEDYTMTLHWSGSPYDPASLSAAGFGGSIDASGMTFLHFTDGSGFMLREGGLVALTRQDADSAAGVRMLGTTGADWLLGGAGDDWLVGHAGHDRLEAGAGNDWIMPRAPTDSGLPGQAWIDGGAGLDTVSFATMTQGIGVQINGFLPGVARVGARIDGRGQSIADLTGVEHIIGTSQADYFYETTYYNLEPGGTSWIRALGGADTLKGSFGADYFDGGAGQDLITFLDGSYENIGSGVSVSLLRGRGWTGKAEGDRYVNVENLEGTRRDDHLTGDHGNNRLDGHAGDDTLMGNGGNDRLWGGKGTDVAIFGHARADYDIIQLSPRMVQVIHARGGQYDGTDTLYQIEVLRFADGDVIL